MSTPDLSIPYTKMFGSNADLPFLEYVGHDGYSQPCVNAVIRLLLAGERFEEAIVVTHDQHEHALILYSSGDPRYAVRWGFTSNSGEGSAAFKKVASVLSAFGARLEESEADDRLWRRFTDGRLTHEDLHRLRRCDGAKHGLRFLGILRSGLPDAATLDQFPLSMSWSIVDARIADLALALYQDPLSALREGYARLEATIRRRARVTFHGKELIAAAFRGRASALHWAGLTQTEADARAELFLAAFKAYRNPLAHGASRTSGKKGQELSEFMLLNRLFRLEGESVSRAKPADVSPIGD
jgi:hypothetical protein